MSEQTNPDSRQTIPDEYSTAMSEIPDLELYNQGHQDGESCRQAEWEFDLGEVLADDFGPVEPYPVAQYIRKLQEALREVRKQLYRLNAWYSLLDKPLRNEIDALLTALDEANQQGPG